MAVRWWGDPATFVAYVVQRPAPPLGDPILNEHYDLVPPPTSIASASTRR